MNPLCSKEGSQGVDGNLGSKTCLKAVNSTMLMMPVQLCPQPILATATLLCWHCQQHTVH